MPRLALGAGSAVAQDKKVRMQMQSNFASTLALLGPNANYTVDQIKKLSAGSIDIKFFEPGALVPPGQAFDCGVVGCARRRLGDTGLLDRQGYRLRRLLDRARSARASASISPG